VKCIDNTPKILIDPSFAITFKELDKKMKGLKTITMNSGLILRGRDTSFKETKVDGFYKVDNEEFTGNKSNAIYLKFVPIPFSDNEEVE
jgi:hypothetical protein